MTRTNVSINGGVFHGGVLVIKGMAISSVMSVEQKNHINHEQSPNTYTTPRDTRETQGVQRRTRPSKGGVKTPDGSQDVHMAQREHGPPSGGG